MFEGGIHPPYNKQLAENKPIERFPMPKRLVIPVSQHIGAPAKVLVSVGDEVKKGQKIGEAGGMISSPIHASSSGKVVAVAPCLHPSGKSVTSVVIETDGNDEWLPGLNKPQELDKNANGSALAKMVFDAGIVGLGGATFPTHVKLTPPKNKTIDTVLLNGAECEPYLVCDYRIMLESADDVISGLSLIMKMIKAKKAHIGIEDNKPDAIEKIKSAVTSVGKETDIQVDSLDTKYPQGGEKQLIKAVLNREVPMGKLPMDVGVLVVNVGTAAALSRAVNKAVPLIERVVTVTGQGIKKAKNLMVPIGTLASEIIKYCGGLTDDTVKVISGGPMMGSALSSLDVPVLKGTSGILALTGRETKSETVRPCINCARCVSACPMGLLPNKLSICGEAMATDAADAYYPFNCIECGCCSYVCPSKRPIVQYIKYIKIELGKKKMKEAKIK